MCVINSFHWILMVIEIPKNRLIICLPEKTTRKLPKNGKHYSKVRNVDLS